MRTETFVWNASRVMKMNGVRGDGDISLVLETHCPASVNSVLGRVVKDRKEDSLPNRSTVIPNDVTCVHPTTFLYLGDFTDTFIQCDLQPYIQTLMAESTTHGDSQLVGRSHGSLLRDTATLRGLN